MDPVRLVVELLFGAILLSTVRRYLIRRDPVSRDVALAFSGFGLTIVAEAWRWAFGDGVSVLGVVDLLLLLLQPVFVLHLVSQLRPLPRRLVPAAAVLIVGTAAASFALRAFPGATYLFAASFVGLEAVAAGSLVAEARRRRGPGGVQFALAAAATGLFALALVIVGLGVATGVGDAASATALGLSLVAAIGYLLAFLPPAPVRRIWHAQATVRYVHDLLGDAGRPVEEIWSRLAIFATTLVGGTAVVVTVAPAGGGVVTSAAGPGASGLRGMEVSADALARLRAPATAGGDVPAEALGPIGRQLADAAAARFVGVVPLGASERAPILVLLSRHRTLFTDTDQGLLATLGGHTAVVADRRAALAEQEALGARLSTTVEALESASQAKSDFLAAMSHELRTPLSAILGFSELMQAEASAGSTEVTVPLEWIEHIHRGGVHLLALINDVLDLSKVEAGRLDLRPEPVATRSAVAEVIEGVRPLAERKHIAIGAPATDAVVLADPGRLRQILYNLLSNAIKYTPDGGRVWLAVDDADDAVRITVADTGVGIAPADFEAIFDEFRQVGDRAGREGGTGLGLALTRRLVEAHGGRVELESEIDRGSRFTVTLPASAAPVRAAPVAASASLRPSAPGDARVLLIEDDASAIRLLREFLEPAGYEVEALSSGRAGIDRARASRPAAILLDVLLPDIDGWEVLRQLKADSALADIPVIVATVMDERELGLALGAVDYLVKPIDQAALLRAVRRSIPAAADATARVLAVDDDPATLDFVQATLRGARIEVVAMTNPREAIDRARRSAFDLVLCDLLMPDLDGFEVVQALKADARTANIPIVLCTAVDLSESDKARLNGQVAGVVAKGSEAATQLRAALRALVPHLDPQPST
jgi:signal transduction histidine kinase/DNA-binding response OmpR family regulator